MAKAITTRATIAKLGRAIFLLAEFRVLEWFRVWAVGVDEPKQVSIFKVGQGWCNNAAVLSIMAEVALQIRTAATPMATGECTSDAME